jgi:hypothetical protein
MEGKRSGNLSVLRGDMALPVVSRIDTPYGFVLRKSVLKLHLRLFYGQNVNYLSRAGLHGGG